jgi:nucleotide-binding universal stress UspA family protein
MPTNPAIYKTILVTLEATEADETILEHIVPLAKLCHSKIVLLHVADGWAARQFGADAVSPEVSEDSAYLQRIQKELQKQGLDVRVELAYGDPSKEIIKWVKENPCDLIAMSTHGHKFVADMFLGTTVHHVRHCVDVPLLLVRDKRRALVHKKLLNRERK